jgi:glycerophosphoryl diester phosphodiesterase
MSAAFSKTISSMTEIFAHRANLEGPQPASENSLAATERAMNLGFGLETDLRRDARGRFYIAHDPGPWTEVNDFANFAALFRKYPGQSVAMNVKELGYEADLIALQQSGDLGDRSFYFDFELLEPKTPGRTQRRIQNLPGGDRVAMASRLSDRGEMLEQCLSIPASVVWADEFDSLWLTRAHVEAVHAAGRMFYAISPELHQFDDAARRKRWGDFKEWRIDGLCTDYALSAQSFFA